MKDKRFIIIERKDRAIKERKKGVIIFDLDNTLVDKNAVFEKAQEQMIEIVKGKKAIKKDMKILRKIDSILIKKNKSHLYPFKILALSLWFYYHKNLNIKKSIQKSLDISQGTYARTKEIEKAVDLAEKASVAHNYVLENTPARLFEGVKEVLQTLRKIGYGLVLLSEGSQSLQQKTLEAHDLGQYFDEIILCDPKDKQCFLDTKERWKRDNDRKFKIIVVGDGIERDIKLGNEIGAITIWKPGNFNPGTPTSNIKQPDYSIKSMKSLLTIIPKNF